MKKYHCSVSLFSLILFFFTLSCKAETNDSTRIHWDSWGVPHIYAQNEDELFFAQGWTQMKLHGNLILEMYGKSRGRAAEYWGEKRLESDILIHTLGFPDLAKEWYEKQDPKLKDILLSYINGMNAYSEAHPEAFEDENRVVLPLGVEDVNLHYLYVVYTRFVGGEELGRVSQWTDMGSNAYAIGPPRSASGKAMLLQNPHLPWWREFLMTEVHLNVKDHNIYGATLIGFPGVEIAFNDQLGWTHTNNTIDNADTYELELKGDGYVFGGKVHTFTKKTKKIKFKDETGALKSRKVEVWNALHGPVVKKTEDKALVIRMVGYDRPNPFLQWWKMATARDFEGFESALEMGQIPFWNVIYADNQANIFFVFNGGVPKRVHGDWDYWDRVIPGGKSEDLWTSIHPYSDLPKIKNPAQGWIQNANDPPWSCTFPTVLSPDSFPSYMAPRDGMGFRPQRAVRMMVDDPSITFEELITYKHSTRMELADRLLDDLFAAIDLYGTDAGKRAKVVLEKWDRNADNDSEGALLFFKWAKKMKPFNPDIYEKKWSKSNATTTPDGLSNPKLAVENLEELVGEMETAYGSISVPWGDAYRINYNGVDLPGNGGDESVGTFRMAWRDYEENNISYIGGGDSWIGIIEFGEKVRAKVLLCYGNSTQADSPHNGDQLRLFSEKKLRDAWFYKEDVKENTQRIEVLYHGEFIPSARNN